MRYNWAGDIIVRDTIVSNKRAVVGYKDKLIPTDIREWIRGPENENLSKALSEINGLPKEKTAGSFDERAILIWEYVAKKITYVHDKEAHGMVDMWMFPEEVLALGKGDCEDSANALCSLLLASGISPFCVRVVLGTVYDSQGKLLGGHAWGVYLDEMGSWRLLESTLDKLPDGMPLADDLTKSRRDFIYKPSLCFNRQHLWQIEPVPLDIKGYLELQRFKVGFSLE